MPPPTHKENFNHFYYSEKLYKILLPKLKNTLYLLRVLFIQWNFQTKIRKLKIHPHRSQGIYRRIQKSFKSGHKKFNTLYVCIKYVLMYNVSIYIRNIVQFYILYIYICIFVKSIINLLLPPLILCLNIKKGILGHKSFCTIKFVLKNYSVRIGKFKINYKT